MSRLKRALDAAGEYQGAQRRRDDRSGHGHRQLIGYLGLSLPAILPVVAGLRPTKALDRWQVLDSISAYYYTGAIAVFVGTLVALGLLLMTYRGFGTRDRVVATIAGIAALCVAAFPTSAPYSDGEPDWWTPGTRYLHYGAAVALFLAFAVFALWLFREKGDRASRDERDGIHLVCGVAILVGIGWAGVAGALHAPIFLPESLAVTAFACSWLTKGRAVGTLRAAGRVLIGGPGPSAGGGME